MNKCNASDVRQLYVACIIANPNIHHVPCPHTCMYPHVDTLPQVAQTLQPFFARMASEFPLKIEPNNAARPAGGTLRLRNGDDGDVSVEAAEEGGKRKVGFERMAISFPLLQALDKKRGSGGSEGQEKKGKGRDGEGKRTACFPLLQFPGWKKVNKQE